MSILSAISSSSSDYLQQLTGTSQTESSGDTQRTRGAGPPPPGGGKGGNRVGGQVKDALASQGLDEETLESIKVEIEAALEELSASEESTSEEVSSAVLEILESYGVDTEQLSEDLSEVAEQVEERIANRSDTYESDTQRRTSAPQSILQALFAFDAEA